MYACLLKLLDSILPRLGLQCGKCAGGLCQATSLLFTELFQAADEFVDQWSPSSAAAILVLSIIGVLPFSIFHGYFWKFEERRRAKGEVRNLLDWLKHANVFLGLVAIYPSLLLFYFTRVMAHEIAPGFFIVPMGFIQIMAFLLSMAMIVEVTSVFGYVYFNSKLEEELAKR